MSDTNDTGPLTDDWFADNRAAGVGGDTSTGTPAGGAASWGGATGASAPAGSRLPVRAGTVVWGGILLFIAAFAAAAIVVDAALFTPQSILWAIVVVGVLLVVGGVIGAIARSATRSSN